MEEIRIITKGAELREIGAREFMEYINPFIREKAGILLDKEVDLKEEERWLERNAEALDAGNVLKVVLFVGGKLSGSCEARRGMLKARHNVSFGLSVSEEFRGRGYGERLLKRAIEEAEKRMNPHKMWIEYMEGNEAARRLYEKAGFVEAARLTEYVDHFGEWRDHVTMEYRKKKD